MSELVKPHIVMTPRDHERENLVELTKALMLKLGFAWWPWHDELIGLISELEYVNGRWQPYYSRADVILPRQTGKTLVLLCYMIAAALKYRLRAVSYTALATSGAIDILANKLKQPLYDAFGEGKEGVIFNHSTSRPGIHFGINEEFGQQTVHILSSSDKAGRGQSPHMLIFDELLEETNSKRITTLVPSLSQSLFKQIIYSSTAPKAHSTVLHGRRNRALAKLEKFKETGNPEDLGRTAYFECRAEDFSDPLSDKAFMQANPSLYEHDPGPDRIVTLSSIKADFEDFEESVDDWCNEYLGMPIFPEDDSNSHVIDPAIIEEHTDESLTIEHPTILAVSSDVEHSTYHVVEASKVGNKVALNYAATFNLLPEVTEYLQERSQLDSVLYIATVNGASIVSPHEMYASTYVINKNQTPQCSTIFQRDLLLGKMVIAGDSQSLIDSCTQAQKHQTAGDDAFTYRNKSDEHDCSLLKAHLYAYFVAERQGIKEYNTPLNQEDFDKEMQEILSQAEAVYLMETSNV